MRSCMRAQVILLLRGFSVSEVRSVSASEILALHRLSMHGSLELRYDQACTYHVLASRIHAVNARRSAYLRTDVHALLACTTVKATFTSVSVRTYTNPTELDRFRREHVKPAIRNSASRYASLRSIGYLVTGVGRGHIGKTTSVSGEQRQLRRSNT